MEPKISQEEFLRLQTQLIELRTNNYALEEKVLAHKVQNRELTAKLETLQKENVKLNSFVNTLRQVKNVDLFNRNEALQLKLQTQEDDFRLQNQTLLKELAMLDAENKKLQIQVSARELENGESEEVKKLKDEAKALQRVLSEERLRSASELNKLKVVLNFLTAGYDEETKKNLCPDLLGDVFENNNGAEVEIDSSMERFSDNEEVENFADSESEAKGLQLSMNSKEELEFIKSNWGVEVDNLDDRIKNKKDNYESLSAALTALDERFIRCRSLGDKMIHELEEQLAGSVEEVNVLKDHSKKMEVQIEDLKKELREKVKEYDIVSAQLIESTKDLEKAKFFSENLKNENSALVESAENFQNGLMKKNEILEEVSAKCSIQLVEINDMKQRMEIEQMAYEKKLMEANNRIMEIQERLNSLEKSKDIELKDLNQKLSDLSADQALYEKKNSVICRDLKRQLALERRRAEKLQDKLRENDTSSSKLELNKSGDVEVASVSSWSLMSGNMEPQESTQENIPAGTQVNTEGNVEELDLEQENKNLLERLTSLQEEKWLLEEQVNHLEQGSAAMAEDLMKKAELIKFYCMDIRAGEHQPSNSGRKGVKRLSEFLKGSEGESMQESHTRMQRMLEETLTKNMYLQRDIEHLSKELESLRTVKPVTEK